MLRFQLFVYNQCCQLFTFLVLPAIPLVFFPTLLAVFVFPAFLTDFPRRRRFCLLGLEVRPRRLLFETDARREFVRFPVRLLLEGWFLIVARRGRF